MTPKEKGDGNRGGRTKWRSAGEDKKGKQESACLCCCLCMWISAEARLPVHGVLGASDTERRYPAWHAHTEAPLMVAWLNPGQTLHCPSVPHLNWPTGQAGDDRTRKWIKQIIMSSGYDYWRTLRQIFTPSVSYIDVAQHEFANTFYLSGCFGARWLQTDSEDHVTRAINWRQSQ